MILGIYGSGGLGRGFRDYIERTEEWDELVFIDDAAEAGLYRDVKRMPFEQFKREYSPDKAGIIIGVGDPKAREPLYHKVKDAGFHLPTIVCQNAIVSQYAALGEGVFIAVGAVVQDSARVGDNAAVMEYSVIAHDVSVGSHTMIAANVLVGGGAVIGELSYVGSGALIRDQVRIGSRTVIGMGSVVLRDVPDGVTTLGNPARVIKQRDAGEGVFGSYYHG